MDRPHGGPSCPKTSGTYLPHHGTTADLHSNGLDALQPVLGAPRLLLIGVRQPPGEHAVMQAAPTWQEAALLLKEQTRQGQAFDLLVLATRLQDGREPWPLVLALRRARPWQAWVLAGPADESGPEVEVRALAHGALGVFDPASQWDQVLALAWSLRQRRADHSAERAAVVPAVLMDRWPAARRVGPLSPEEDGP